jgi:hypothetical protein
VTAPRARPTCDTPGCGRPIPVDGEGYPEICPTCLKWKGQREARDVATDQLAQAVEECLAHLLKIAVRALKRRRRSDRRRRSHRLRLLRQRVLGCAVPRHAPPGDEACLMASCCPHCRTLRDRVSELETQLRDNAAKLQEGIDLAAKLVAEKGVLADRLEQALGHSVR